jgi:hypothetical protein
VLFALVEDKEVLADLVVNERLSGVAPLFRLARVVDDDHEDDHHLCGSTEAEV